jgi:hypothetical protein
LGTNAHLFSFLGNSRVMEVHVKSRLDIGDRLGISPTGALECADVSEVENCFGNLLARPAGSGFGNKAHVLAGFECVAYTVMADASRCRDGEVGHPLTVQVDDHCFFGGFRVGHDPRRSE